MARSMIQSIEIRDGIKIVTLIDGSTVEFFYSATMKEWITVPE